MSEETIVAIYDTRAHADAAIRDLQAAQVPSGAISRHAAATGAASSSPVGSATTPHREPGFWNSLFGGDSTRDAAVYDRSIDAGSEVVTVRVAEDRAGAVSDILERHHPIDIEERATGYGMGAAGATTTTTHEPLGAATASATLPVRNMEQDNPVQDNPVRNTLQDTTQGHPVRDTVQEGGEERLELAEERLKVGKRLVNRGTTRIRRFVVETPVEERVTLHAERVAVERRPVTGERRVSEADFTDKTIELTETQEEAVVEKTAHVTEEIVVRKDASDRVETIHDTVRHEDVEITRDQPDATVDPAANTVPPVRR